MFRIAQKAFSNENITCIYESGKDCKNSFHYVPLDQRVFMTLLFELASHAFISMEVSYQTK